MDFEWDDGKDRTNRQKHQISLERARDFDWHRAKGFQDLRRDYGEDRFLAYGFGFDGIGYVVVYTVRAGNYRIISMRPFGKKDYAIYETL